MAIAVPRGKSDEVIEKIISALQTYVMDHPHSQIDLYRQNPVSVRLRIIDPDFAKLSKPQRNQLAWKYLDSLPDDVHGDISMVVLLTPDETKQSFANLEFEDPVPSTL